ncbi:axonemal dynein light chain domain-containing protein 1-like isoform X2 [Triplophysa rosa]|uniref:axonemal dynein light chain domain-containing protein 1-like isoform X2 n=1 Tax=Triplophysa rosa TaxID=992332 RepID=UPI0025462507|nr:axonemal dynein light chain domain-containing protein 1-like isoform X2 [Triplophysa rosa]XP_057181488.1 axonemal dynein light chain domain-containing protein 1-like isoform X2 [Triplophysa rosa]XP_057181489.1 axonemal dynein light chain domain-containing protein 1-like isoform X2 [Triplophysa rosa]XP_057181490.1 axonemal dynein light chain domain-containing protein 1-like isoform X2 [Triplophysa rosa]
MVNGVKATIWNIWTARWRTFKTTTKGEAKLRYVGEWNYGTCRFHHPEAYEDHPSCSRTRRHPASDGGPPKGQEAMGELSKTITELHKQLGIRINGGSGIHATLMSLSDNMEFWSRSLKSRSGPELHPSGDWVKMEEALGSLRNLQMTLLCLLRLRMPRKPSQL